MPRPEHHHPQSPLMDDVDREAEALASRYGGFVPGAALAEALRNLMRDHDRRLAEMEAVVTDLAATAFKMREPAR